MIIAIDEAALGKSMNLIQGEGRHRKRLLVFSPWAVLALLVVNALYFVLRVSNPIIEADGWFYLESFLKKAIEHKLAFFDLFLKRGPDDHAAPLFRLLLLINYHYFDLDYVMEAVVGCIAAAACCLIYRTIIFSYANADPKAVLSLSWMTICALQLSLNSVGIWVWPLVSLENLTQLIILFFIMTVWHAHRAQRYLALVATTLFLGITCDDSAILAVLATMMAYGFMLLANPAHLNRPAWKVFLIVAACMTLVRIGYAWLPLTASADPHRALATLAPSLLNHFRNGGWWQWLFLPLVLPVYYENPFGPSHSVAWHFIQAFVAIFLLAAHISFWRKALNIKYDLTAFAAVSLMFLTYGWIAGIVLWRVSWAGNAYLEQPRYVLFYAGQLISLLLMWSSASKAPLASALSQREFKAWPFMAACLLLLFIQIPQSLTAWHVRRYEWIYYVEMDRQLQGLTKDPVNFTDCALLQPICSAAPYTRKTLTRLLREKKLNIFSPKVQHWHRYLPAARDDAG